MRGLHIQVMTLYIDGVIYFARADTLHVISAYGKLSFSSSRQPSLGQDTSILEISLDLLTASWVFALWPRPARANRCINRWDSAIITSWLPIRLVCPIIVV